MDHNSTRKYPKGENGFLRKKKDRVDQKKSQTPEPDRVGGKKGTAYRGETNAPGTAHIRYEEGPTAKQKASWSGGGCEAQTLGQEKRRYLGRGKAVVIAEGVRDSKHVRRCSAKKTF